MRPAATAPPRRSRWRRALRAVLLAPAAVVLLFEEWGWEPLAALAARLARAPLLARLERSIAGLRPAAALLVFGVPVLALLPVKLLALFLLGGGHTALALAMLVAAKLAGTAIVARLFQLTQPALMEIPLFARAYTAWKSWKDRLLAALRASPAARLVRQQRLRLRRWWRSVRGRG